MNTSTSSSSEIEVEGEGEINHSPSFHEIYQPLSTLCKTFDGVSRRCSKTLSNILRYLHLSGSHDESLRTLREELQRMTEERNHHEAEANQYKVERDTAQRALDTLRKGSSCVEKTRHDLDLDGSTSRAGLFGGMEVEMDEWGVAKFDSLGHPIPITLPTSTSNGFPSNENLTHIDHPSGVGLMDLQRRSLIDNAGRIEHFINHTAESVQSALAEERLKATDEVTLRALDTSVKAYNVRRDLVETPNEEVRDFVRSVLGDTIRECFNKGDMSLDSIFDQNHERGYRYQFTPAAKTQKDGFYVSLIRAFNNGTKDDGYGDGKRYGDSIGWPKFHTPVVRGYFAEAEKHFDSKNIDKLTERVISQGTWKMGANTKKRWEADTKRIVRSYLASTLEGERIKRERQGRSGQGNLEDVSVKVNPVLNYADGKTFSMDWKDEGKYFESIPPSVNLLVDPDFALRQDEPTSRTQGNLFSQRAKGFMGSGEAEGASGFGGCLLAY
ncbi:hypothetical protein I302_104602 [Kwoniella bestiolae CBS 10118]|uniref:Uncharacterized protein n=1 Tax=Kwoniella bestiolae CBS 10118 TaxID=1296100 RepID=A0A1B9GBQ8_9TREE|nr:hypothetical protein I302_03309 [Kwoniella bestiolae CBS 10118]OCF28450.1 hypothetical protein I302_03309 [Kwoniella bestiolae CBS 10118]